MSELHENEIVTASSSARFCIGYMEDDQIMRERTANGLAAHGCAVQTLYSKQDVVEYIKGFTNCPILLLDIDLGFGKSFFGLRLSRIAKSLEPSTIVILLSSHIESIDNEKFLASKADYYIPKSALLNDVDNVVAVCEGSLGIGNFSGVASCVYGQKETDSFISRFSYTCLEERRRTRLLRSLKPFSNEGVVLSSVFSDYGFQLFEHKIEDFEHLRSIIRDDNIELDDISSVATTAITHISSPRIEINAIQTEQFLEDVRGSLVRLDLLRDTEPYSSNSYRAVCVHRKSGCIRSFGNVEEFNDDESKLDVQVGYLDLIDPESDEDKISHDGGIFQFTISCYIFAIDC